ncbi:interferon-induced GTP-binding protein Mx-like [Sinocyclocheilus rhinocerous]|uniref:interferon-induced GTP-binding protein Mx-like n=1 Tax=Sinocyclocheilus rhinocerous TaxID=307959 RepID=UPI0007B81E17|nr:PREDICTED: interferon-induced GTP-binding protein Mx-like [Sinocyclocheilus rhinocerous]
MELTYTMFFLNLSPMQQSSRTVLQCPRLASSVEDPPLVSAHAAGIPKPAACCRVPRGDGARCSFSRAEEAAYELSALSVTAKDAVCEFPDCSVAAARAILELSNQPVATEALNFSLGPSPRHGIRITLVRRGGLLLRPGGLLSCLLRSDSQTHGAIHNHFIESVQPLIELIDSLRLIGIYKDIDLPSIAVVGDQSSGKSFVLEALSGVAVPRGSVSPAFQRSCPSSTSFVPRTPAKDQRQDGQRLERYVEEFLELANQVSWHDAALVEEIKAQSKSRRPAPSGTRRVSPAHLPPGTPTFRANSSDHLRNPQNPRVIRSSTIVLSPERPPEHPPVPVPRKRFTILECSRRKAPVPEYRPRRAPIPEYSPRKAPVPDSLLNHGKASIQCLADNLTKELVHHIKKSLPYLIEQIQTTLLTVEMELKNYDQGPPLEEEKMGPFLSEIIMEFSDQINELSITGHSKDQNIYALLRPEFKKWEMYLRGTEVSCKSRIYTMIDKYNEMHRGRELLTFSDFCEFESVIKDHVAALRDPAIATLKHVQEIVQNVFRDICYSSFDRHPPLRYTVSKITNDIHSKQEAKVEKRIKEFIDMEQLVFTQDKVLQQKLNASDVPQKTGMDSCHENLYDDNDTILNSKGCALLDTRYLVPDKLVLYHEAIQGR